MLGVHDLRYFRTAARSTSFRQAARALAITQPALTHMVQRLEAHVGHTLFERRRSGVTLTAAGHRLLAQVDPLIQQWESLGQDLTDADRRLEGRVTIGCHPSVAQYTLKRFLPDLLAAHPALNVRLVHDLSRLITDAVNAGTIELGIVVNPFAFPDLVIRRLMTDEVTLWSRPNAPTDILVCDPGLSQTQWILRKLPKGRFARVIESSNLEVIKALAEAGAGVAILPSRVAATSRTKLRRSDPKFIYSDRVCLVYRPAFAKSHVGRTVVDAISAACVVTGRE